MRKYDHLVMLVICSAVYMVSAFYWELSIYRLVSWWGRELIEMRPSLTTLESLFYAGVAIVYGLLIVPQFVMFPVTLFKELNYLYHDVDTPSHRPVVKRQRRLPSQRFLVTAYC